MKGIEGVKHPLLACQRFVLHAVSTYTSRLPAIHYGDFNLWRRRVSPSLYRSPGGLTCATILESRSSRMMYTAVEDRRLMAGSCCVVEARR